MHTCSAGTCCRVQRCINQPDESRCQKPLSEQVASSRSTEKLQNDVPDSIQLISKILSHGEACALVSACWRAGCGRTGCKEIAALQQDAEGRQSAVLHPGLGEDSGEGQQ